MERIQKLKKRNFKASKIEQIKVLRNFKTMAPDAGFEPATKRLTAAYSTAELIRNA